MAGHTPATNTLANSRHWWQFATQAAPWRPAPDHYGIIPQCPLKSFREFIEAEPLRGLGESVADIERLLADEPEALARLREELKASEWERNPKGKNQYSEVTDNNVSRNQPDL